MLRIRRAELVIGTRIIICTGSLFCCDVSFDLAINAICSSDYVVGHALL
jgi:hypothetical protein